MVDKTCAYALMIVILLIIVFNMRRTGRERFDPAVNSSVGLGLSDYPPETVPVLSAVSGTVAEGAPYVRLYEGPNATDLAFDFTPVQTEETGPGDGFMRIMLPISLRSLDINLPAGDPFYDPQRVVQIWQMFGDENIASTVSPFYNAYTEPDWARRANSAQYKLIATVAAGERLVANVSGARVRRIFLHANLI